MVGVDDPLGDAQAQTYSAGFSRPRLIHPVEPFEDLLLLLTWNANSGILYFEEDVLLVFLKRDMDRSFRSIFYGVVNQVGQELLEAYLSPMTVTSSVA